MFRITIAALIVVLPLSAAPRIRGQRRESRHLEHRDRIGQRIGNTAATQSTPRLGDTPAFKTTVEPLAGWEYPMVAVSIADDETGFRALVSMLCVRAGQPKPVSLVEKFRLTPASRRFSGCSPRVSERRPSPNS
jgi:hypothetical protein